MTSPLHRSLALVGVLASTATAQEAGFSADRHRIGAGQPPAVALRTADMDGNGLPDLIRLAEDSLSIFLQDNAGRFSLRSTAVTPSPGSFFRDVAIGRLRGGQLPNLPDVAVMSANGAVEILRNQGAGVLSSVAPSPVAPLFAAPACQLLVADLDGVSGDDVIVLLDGGPLLMFLYLADGSGGFTEGTLTLVPDNVSLSTPAPHAGLGDFNGDGDLDLVVVSTSTAPVLLDNDLNGNEGLGVFSVVASAFPDGAPSASRVLAANVVGGPLPDIVFGLAGPTERAPRLFPNSGTGFVNTANLSDFATKGLREMQAGDVDGDLIADLIALQDDGSVLVGKGSATGKFGVARELLVAGARTALAVADLENDGDLDICTGGSRLEDQVLLGRGDGEFLDTETVDFPIGPAPANHLGALVDVDRNGDPDVVIYDRNGIPQWFRNDGSARFVAEDAAGLPVLPPGVGYQFLLTASVSHPGRRDLLAVGNPGGVADPVRVLVETVGGYLDQTTLRFPAVGIPDVAAVARGPVCTQDGLGGELDDLVIADSSGGLHLAQNVGGSYAMVGGAFPGPPLASVSRILLGDIDGDGNCDVVALQDSDPARFFLGTGAGTFSEPFDPSRSAPAARDGELGDVDGNGSLDLVLVRPDPLTGIEVLLGDGGGSLTDATGILTAQPRGHITDLALLGANSGVADSGADLLVATDNAADQILKWIGVGYGLPIELPFRGSMQTTALLTGDIDREGDTDVVTLRRRSLPGLLRNNTWHLSTTTAAQIGRVLGLRFKAPVPGTVAFLFLGPAQPAAPTPFGLLRINPPALLVQAVLPTGNLEVNFPLPATLGTGTPPLQVAFVDPLLNIHVSNLEFVVLTNH